jgi:hypothetical protein
MASGEVSGLQPTAFSVRDALDPRPGNLPDPDKVAPPWRGDGRPDLSARLARERLESHVAGILAAGASRDAALSD